MKGSRQGNSKSSRRGQKEYGCVPALRFSRKEKENQRQVQRTEREDKIALPCGLVKRTENTIPSPSATQAQHETAIPQNRQALPTENPNKKWQEPANPKKMPEPNPKNLKSNKTLENFIKSCARNESWQLR